MKEARDRLSLIKLNHRGVDWKFSNSKPIKATLLHQKDKCANSMFCTPKNKQKAKQRTIEETIRLSDLYRQMQSKLELMTIKYKSEIARLKQTEIKKLKTISQLSNLIQTHKGEVQSISKQIQQIKHQIIEQQEQYYYLTTQNPQQQAQDKDEDNQYLQQSYHESQNSSQQKQQMKINKIQDQQQQHFHLNDQIYQ